MVMESNLILPSALQSLHCIHCHGNGTATANLPDVVIDNPIDNVTLTAKVKRLILRYSPCDLAFGQDADLLRTASSVKAPVVVPHESSCAF